MRPVLEVAMLRMLACSGLSKAIISYHTATSCVRDHGHSVQAVCRPENEDTASTRTTPPRKTL